MPTGISGKKIKPQSLKRGYYDIALRMEKYGMEPIPTWGQYREDPEYWHRAVKQRRAQIYRKKYYRDHREELLERQKMRQRASRVSRGRRVGSEVFFTRRREAKKTEFNRSDMMRLSTEKFARAVNEICQGKVILA